jgi:type II secretory pathway pseudopilin PulG
MESHRHHGEAGTTLLEMLIAVGLMLVLTAIAVPNFRQLDAPWALRSAAFQVAADLNGARLGAISHDVRYRVRFDTASNTYAVERETAPNNFVADRGAQMLPSGTSLGAVLQNPIFDTRGMLTVPVVVPLNGAGGRTRTVTINVLGKTTIS